ncbi:MAG TPA: T9SS type A sorting domain-containing protein, partial [Chitinophagales bacterium]|nr:T9SS type A sorting domain-containing protein [Chitinophagales bacterium]
QDVYYSRIIPDVVSGINPVSNSPAFSVFPNPGDGIFVIKSETNPVLIEVHTLVGEKVYAATRLNNKNEIDISAQPAGIYFLKVMSREGSITTKKIVRK